MARVLGIDQSFTKCAYVLLDDGVLVNFGIISSSKDEDIYQRAWGITQELLRFCHERPIDHCAIEGLAFGMRGNATRDLAGLQFCIVCALRFIGNLPSIEILSPTTVKKFATGSGKADKRMMVDALPEIVRKTFELKGVKKNKGLDDLADAYFIARLAGENISNNK
jgi:Holliday junction resolvasome RuvABC endonuclease subunit